MVLIIIKLTSVPSSLCSGSEYEILDSLKFSDHSHLYLQTIEVLCKELGEDLILMSKNASFSEHVLEHQDDLIKRSTMLQETVACLWRARDEQVYLSEDIAHVMHKITLIAVQYKKICQPFMPKIRPFCFCLSKSLRIARLFLDRLQYENIEIVQ